VLVEVAACGICGTDLHILDGEFTPSLPIIPGHEFSGTVAALGAASRDANPAPSVGTRIAVDPSLYWHE
jgi:D-arabinose 1-dehydrogenase-like Zn-dependent alcohol dehydrogenase